ncbi:class I histocompatibility antigen, F10 alpha chain-like [Athene noctua]|uniref:class I histocompatibility antigen, F10 alpha chain-like n=1 Tax=Athene noctua TaxID=126797 RepID=UPI003EBA9B68
MSPGRALDLGLLLGILGWAASGPHSLRYFHVAVSEPSPGVPEFVIVGYLDGNLISRYDSDVGRAVPRAGWVEKNLDEDHWDSLTEIGQSQQQYHHMHLDRVRGRYNQSGRGQTLQQMYGCDILEDGSSRGVYQTAFDGQDFMALDADKMTLTATDTTAQMSKRECEAGAGFQLLKHFLEDTCVEWLRKYVSYGRAVLERKEPPTVRVSGKEADGFLTLYCRAYGFYPRPIAVSWLKGGEVRDQDTERGSVAPNSDGTYYTWASIEARPEEKDEYRCRVEHASLPEPGLFAWEPESSQVDISLWMDIAVLAVMVIITMCIR